MTAEAPIATALPAAGYRPCVGIVLLGEHGSVFAGRRSDMGSSAWQMPQGGIDPGERPETAAWRELAEEVGTDDARLLGAARAWFAYDLPPAVAAGLWGGRYRGQTQKWFAFRFTGRDRDIRLDRHGQEFADWCWLPPDELLRRIVAFKRPVYRRVVDEFRHLWA